MKWLYRILLQKEFTGGNSKQKVILIDISRYYLKSIKILEGGGVYTFDFCLILDRYNLRTLDNKNLT